jgi:hypothetical protein
MNFTNDAIVQSLSQALLQHLSSNSGNQQHLNANSGNQSLTNLAQLLLRSSHASAATATPSPPHTPSAFRVSGVRTPQGTTLVRTPSVSSVSSSASSSTSSSDSTPHSQHDWSDDQDDDREIQRRRPSSATQNKDTKVVTYPILSLLDANYLALHPDVQNTMFRKKFRKRTRDGKRILKKFKDIVIPVFKLRTRTTIRHLTNSHLGIEQRLDPDITYEML